MFISAFYSSSHICNSWFLEIFAFMMTSRHQVHREKTGGTFNFLAKNGNFCKMILCFHFSYTLNGCKLKKAKLVRLVNKLPSKIIAICGSSETNYYVWTMISFRSKDSSLRQIIFVIANNCSHGCIQNLMICILQVLFKRNLYSPEANTSKKFLKLDNCVLCNEKKSSNSTSIVVWFLKWIESFVKKTNFWTENKWMKDDKWFLADTFYLIFKCIQRMLFNKREKNSKEICSKVCLNWASYGIIFYFCIFIIFRHQQNLFNVDMRCGWRG